MPKNPQPTVAGKANRLFDYLDRQGLESQSMTVDPMGLSSGFLVSHHLFHKEAYWILLVSDDQQKALEGV